MKKIGLIAVVFLIVFTLSACSDICVGTECITGEIPEEVDCTLNPDDPACESCEEPEPCETCDICEEPEPCETCDICEEPEPCETCEDLPSNLITYPHINGHGVVTEDQMAVVLFEEEMLGYVKYQVSYLSCTCRNSDVNYWQVMYIEISTTDNSIQRISFDSDKESGTHTYTAGMWGDSSPTPGPSMDYSDGKYYEDFVAEFIPWLVGQTPTSLDGISVFTNADYHGIQNTTTIAEQALIDDYAGSSVSTNNMIRIVKAMFDYHIENYG